MRDLPILVAFLAASAAQAETATIIAPVFAQLVTAPLPDGFVPAYEDAHDTGYINEAVPEGESVENWSQLITLTGAKGLALGDEAVDANGFAEFLAESYHQACPDSFSAAALDVDAVPGVQDLFAGYLSCGTSSGGAQSESMVFVVLVGAEDIYTLQWAEHGPASAAPIDFPGGVWTDRLAVLQARAKVCDIVPGEQPPYPSCTD
jgi:hypothetical protein